MFSHPKQNVLQCKWIESTCRTIRDEEKNISKDSKQRPLNTQTCNKTTTDGNAKILKGTSTNSKMSWVEVAKTK